MSDPGNSSRITAVEHYLRDLHKENTLFLNKAILAIPAFILPLLFPLFEAMKSNLGKGLLLVAMTSLSISVLLLLYSMFTSEAAIESAENADDPNHHDAATRLNARVKLQNKIAFYGIAAGFFFTLMAVGIPFFYQCLQTNGETMNDKTKQSFAHDGVTIAPSAMKCPVQPEYKNGLTVSPAAVATIANKPAPAAPTPPSPQPSKKM